MTEIVPSVKHLPERHQRELLRGERVQAELDVLAQRRLKEASDLLETRHIEGLGQKVMCIAPGLAARLRVVYGMSCLHDPDFRKALLRDNPFLRVKCQPARFSLRVNGFKRPSSFSNCDLRFANGESERAAGDHVARGEPAKPFDGGNELEPQTPDTFGHETRTGGSLAPACNAPRSIAGRLPSNRKSQIAIRKSP